MNTIYLHIGTAKTGTTAIQNFCSENQEVLNQQGYYYPEFTYRYPSASRLRNGHFLFGRVHDEDGLRDDKREEEIFQEGFHEIYKAFKKYQNIILSDEGLWTCGFRDEKNVWEKIMEEVGEKQIAIKVIVYLRMQDTFLYSWWSQRVKEGLRAESQLTWERMVNELPMIQLDYYDMLERIADYVGRDNIIVRRFETERFIGGTLYTDFIDALGLTYSEEFHVKSEMRNISLTRNSNEIKRILNRLPGLDTDENALFRQLLVEQSGYQKENDIYNMFSEEERTVFLAKYHEGNIRIAKEYLGEEELFLPKDGKKKKWNPHDGYMLEDVILFFGSLAMQIEKELKEQKKELKEQKRQINGIRNIMKHPIGAIGRKLFSR
ncbi:MAG: hypothetical protein K2J90_06570 [Lachnospiraceae bacterium]|nr:hypothetical protein [Lachnospiraceae bacterium]